MVRRLGRLSFAMQVAQGTGTLAREVFGATDTGLPLLDEPGTLLVPANLDDFADGLDVPAEEVWHFLAVREAAQDRKSTRLNSSHVAISYAVFCLKKKKSTHIEFN